MLRFLRSQRIRLDWVTELNWRQLWEEGAAPEGPSASPTGLHFWVGVLVQASWAYYYFFLIKKIFLSVNNLLPFDSRCTLQYTLEDKQRTSFKSLFYFSSSREKTWFYFMFYLFFSWSIIALQYCVSFWYTAKWISYMSVCGNNLSVHWQMNLKMLYIYMGILFNHLKEQNWIIFEMWMDLESVRQTEVSLKEK